MTGPGRMLDGWVSVLPAAGQRFVEMAYVAVGTFFVLSGFVLARSYFSTLWDRSSLVQYGIARWARLYPVFFLSLLVIAPIMLVDLLFAPGLGGPGQRFGYLLNYGLVLQGWSPLPVDWNPPAWSLSCEVFFYLCLPAAIVPLRRVSGRGVLGIALVAIAFPPVVRALAEEWKPLLHLGDFLMGIAAAGLYELLMRRGPRLAGRGHCVYLPSALLGAAVILAGPSSAPWSLLDTLLRVANAGFILGLAFGGGWPARALSGRAALLGGTASYAMYILHIPLLWWYKRSPVYHALGATAVAALFFFAALVVVSALVYRFVEDPANQRIRERLGRRLGKRCTLMRPEKASAARIPLHC
jgi:peptidoglycan/LPS O-acetylase OafA/YrhL